MKVIISNGNFKFILGVAAEEAEKRGILGSFITTGYPTKFYIRIISFFKIGSLSLVKRFLLRRENIPNEKVTNYYLSELFIQLGLFVRRLTGQSSYTDFLDDVAFKSYGYANRNIFKKVDGDIYHFRSAYGLESVIKARSNGIISVCDHSIAHPEICEYLIKNNGQLPDVKKIININAYWKNMLDDINNADHCIVNSDFVKKTFINRNYDPSKVHVVYTGIDNDFLNVVPKKILNTSNKKLNMIFIGEFGYRKGADILLEALAKVNNIDWKITIVGRVDPSILIKYNKILYSNRVLMVGFIPRLELADLLSKSDIFIFPSLAEGSARVAYMAMACGCYIITTENCGSVAVDKMSGSIVTPGSIMHLVDAITYCSNLSKMDLLNVGEFNSALIRNKYTQNNYGNSLLKVYNEIMYV